MNKSIITNWEIGDCFVKQIDATIYPEYNVYPEYNNKYLIVICSGYYQFSNNKRLLPTLYLKLSNKPVTSQKDIDDAEFVIWDKIPWCMRYWPYSGLESQASLEARRDKTILYPDDYGFLTEYQVMLFPSRQNKIFFEGCDYYKYVSFKKPLDEFLHWRDNTKVNFQGISIFTPFFYKLLIEKYRLYNLRKWVFYQLPREEVLASKDNFSLIQRKYSKFIHDYKEDKC